MSHNQLLLSSLSPVWKAMLGDFMEHARGIEHADFDVSTLNELLQLCCGIVPTETIPLGRIMELIILADYLGMEPFVQAVADMLEKQLCLNTCVRLLGRCKAVGMSLLEEEVENWAAKRFEEVSSHPEFTKVPAQALSAVLRREELESKNEESVWEAVVRWLNAYFAALDDSDCALKDGLAVMEGVRFGLMSIVTGIDFDSWISGREAFLPELSRPNDTRLHPLLINLIDQARLAKSHADPSPSKPPKTLTERCGAAGVRWDNATAQELSWLRPEGGCLLAHKQIILCATRSSRSSRAVVSALNPSGVVTQQYERHDDEEEDSHCITEVATCLAIVGIGYPSQVLAVRHAEGHIQLYDLQSGDLQSAIQLDACKSRHLPLNAMAAVGSSLAFNCISHRDEPGLPLGESFVAVRTWELAAFSHPDNMTRSTPSRTMLVLPSELVQENVQTKRRGGGHLVIALYAWLDHNSMHMVAGGLTSGSIVVWRVGSVVTPRTEPAFQLIDPKVAAEYKRRIYRQKQTALRPWISVRDIVEFHGMLLAVVADGHLRVWALESQQLLRVLDVGEGNLPTCLTVSGRNHVVVGISGGLMVWSLPSLASDSDQPHALKMDLPIQPRASMSVGSDSEEDRYLEEAHRNVQAVVPGPRDGELLALCGGHIFVVGRPIPDSEPGSSPASKQPLKRQRDEAPDAREGEVGEGRISVRNNNSSELQKVRPCGVGCNCWFKTQPPHPHPHPPPPIFSGIYQRTCPAPEHASDCTISYSDESITLFSLVASFVPWQKMRWTS